MRLQPFDEIFTTENPMTAEERKEAWRRKLWALPETERVKLFYKEEAVIFDNTKFDIRTDYIPHYLMRQAE